jgi:cap1 methyltransferase
MMTDRDEEWEQLGDARAKRQRSTIEPHQTFDENRGRDYYEEILEGHYTNGQIRNSWLKVAGSSQSSNDESSGMREQGISPNQSLSLQLLQVKRRLWPAAERCAEVYETSPHGEFAQARRRCNPMESLGEGRERGLNYMFMNRSAIKLANIDAILGFVLTTPTTTTATPDHFLFVDLCGAPGGFSEYLMTRLQSTRTVGSCMGYGMSLVGTNEHGNGTPWKLEHMCYLQGSFQTNYCVSGGADETGDLYQWENVVALGKDIQNDIQSSGLPPQKVHLVVADGGFDAQRDSECQEELAQKLVLCQVVAGLYLLGQGGTMIVKMFGFQTSTVRTAMRALYDLFDEFVALKPISSRPASSERYVVFSGFRGVPHNWDGPSWMNKVLLGTVLSADKAHYLKVDRYLDEFDRDMITLNLKTCFAILSCLDRKLAAQASWPSWPPQEEDAWDSECPPVNVNLYKHAWQLN